MKRCLVVFIIFFFLFPARIFPQTGASAVRDYVGLINQTYHPSIVSYFEKIKTELKKEGAENAVKNIDIFLSGAFGSGFLYSDARGNLYVLTNNHVIAQAHTLSITFERPDGTSRKVENLTIIATDEENDLAVLSVPSGGVRPYVNRGMTLVTRFVEEGKSVFAAGFPGLGMTPLWQFSNGIVSNSAARFPKNPDEPSVLMGPFIQHTSQIDFGNSGGPLLVAQANAPSNYAVAGINTLSAVHRQNTNFAVPSNIIQTFINRALNPRPETFREALDERLVKFTDGFKDNKTPYTHIADFLSAACVGENAEWATEEIFKASYAVRRAFVRRFEVDVIGAMGLAVAWTIENEIKSGSNFETAIKEVSGSGDEYNVIFTINKKDFNSEWVREYGNWRIKSFGTVATGDIGRLEKRQTKRAAVSDTRNDSLFRIETGYAYLFNKSDAAFYAAVDFSLFGLNIYAAEDLFSIGFFGTVQFPLPVGSVVLTPYIRAGAAFVQDNDYENWEKRNNDLGFGFYLPLMLQTGMKVSIPGVPGLYANAGLQYNANLMKLFDRSDSYIKPYDNYFDMALTISAGYSF